MTLFTVLILVQSHQQQPDASFGLARPRWGAWAMPARCQLELDLDMMRSCYSCIYYLSWQECRHRGPGWTGVEVSIFWTPTFCPFHHLGFDGSFFIFDEWWRSSLGYGNSYLFSSLRTVFCHWWRMGKFTRAGKVINQLGWRSAFQNQSSSSFSWSRFLFPLSHILFIE